ERHRSGWRATSHPSSVTLPLSKPSSPARIAISVDLPAPLGPNRPNTPWSTSNEKSDSAMRPVGYTLVTRAMESILVERGGVGVAAGTAGFRRTNARGQPAPPEIIRQADLPMRQEIQSQRLESR